MITEAQRDQMRHALGLTRGKKGYRNRFVTSRTDPEWMDLVRKGLARRHINNWLGTQDACFRVTMAGMCEVMKKGERMCPEELPDLFGSVSLQKIK